MELDLKKCARALALIVVGVVFIVSALAKLSSIDSFVLYVFSFGFFSFDVSSVLARLVVGGELFLGAGLLSGLYSRFFKQAALFALAVFTLFLFALLVMGEEGNCHCMGEAFELSPGKSVLKNVALVALLYFGERRFGFRLDKLAVALIAVFAFVGVFAYVPPDFLLKKKELKVGENNLMKYLNEKAAFDGTDFQKGKYIICFYSTKCKVCLLSARKMDLFMDRYNIPDTSVVQLFKAAYGTDFKAEGIEDELESQLLAFSEKSEARLVEKRHFVKDADLWSMTHVVPMFVFLKDGKVVDKLNYRGLTEERIELFLSKE